MRAISSQALALSQAYSGLLLLKLAGAPVEMIDQVWTALDALSQSIRETPALPTQTEARDDY